jgi:hypothetical protein
LAAPAVVRDLREHWAPASAEELERFETDVLSGFVLARASAGLADGTLRGDVGHLDQIRTWFGRPLWDMEPADADAYFGKVPRNSPSGTRLGRSQALTTYFMFLELRPKVEPHRMTGPGRRVRSTRGTGRAGPRTPSCGFRRVSRRSEDGSPAGAANWRPAASSPLPPETTRPRNCCPRWACGWGRHAGSIWTPQPHQPHQGRSQRVRRAPTARARPERPIRRGSHQPRPRD